MYTLIKLFPPYLLGGGPAAKAAESEIDAAEVLEMALENSVGNKPLTARRKSVLRVIWRWITDFPRDLEEDEYLRAFLVKFFNRVSMDYPQIGSIFISKMAKFQFKARHRFGDRLPPITPEFRIPRMTANMPLSSLDPGLIAVCLTKRECGLFAAIPAYELLDGRWGTGIKEDAPNIHACISNFNFVATIVADEILSYTSRTERARVYTHFVDVAVECINLNSFNAAMEIVAGLNNAAIFRLRKTKVLLGAETLEKLAYVESVTSHEGSYKALRESIAEAGLPCVPYLGVYLTDLTFIAEALPLFADDGNMVNCGRMSSLATVLLEIQRLQTCGYTLPDFPAEVESAIFDRALPDERDLYAKSLDVEPRIRKKKGSSSKPQAVE